jgi:uncharacterized protein YigE (DUF2233 family)
MKTKYAILLPVFIVLYLCYSAKSQSSQTETERQLGRSGLFKLVTYRGKQYFICTLNSHEYKVELFNRLPNNGGNYDFRTIATEKGKALLFAMNGGMYEQDLRPVGLYVSKGKTINPLNTKDGTGNFYNLKPNGVFFIDRNQDATVVTTDVFASGHYEPEIATQSGPMLVIDGAFNSNFKETSVNFNVRNGVGITRDRRVAFVVSVDKVNFYELSQLFREKLGCANALYLDGFVSQYFAPELQNEPVAGVPLGVFIAVSRK